MASCRSRSVRFRDYDENGKSSTSSRTGGRRSEWVKSKLGLKREELFENYEVVDGMIWDPIMNKWNKILLVACLVSLFVDPLFFYLPVAKVEACIEVSSGVEVGVTMIRSMMDAFYITKMVIKFRRGYIVASSSSSQFGIFGRGELVDDPLKIAANYLFRDFWMDFAAALPLPQVFIWAAIPNIKGSNITPLSNVLRLSTIFQYLLRLYLIFPLSSQIIKATGLLMKTAWAGAVYNLMLFMLASHVLGSCWYLLSIGRQIECWKKVCGLGSLDCKYEYFDCEAVNDPIRVAWFKASNLSILCHPTSPTNFFHFGIYSDSLTFGLFPSTIFNRFFYCFWWGLRNLSSLGQNLLTSSNVGEIIFAIIIAIVGLVLFALLIGNMQTYLQSTTLRLEEWRVMRTDTEQWMHHRQLPYELKQSVRKYDQFRWIATRGVDEEHILKGLPMDLRRDIKRHLCLDLVRQVPLFDEMDDRMLDAICERLRPSLCTSDTYLVREGDPVNEMLFIIRGHLDSFTTNGGRTGFFNSSRLGPTDFCGEELLPWVLDPRPSIVLPSSTRTVRAITEVEAFALIADDLKFVAAQFRRLHSKQLRYTFRFYSHQWRTWAACFIQAAWFSYKRRKEAAEVKSMEIYVAATAAAKKKKNTGLGLHKKEEINNILSSLQKPIEPDFYVDV